MYPMGSRQTTRFFNQDRQRRDDAGARRRLSGVVGRWGPGASLPGRLTRMMVRCENLAGLRIGPHHRPATASLRRAPTAMASIKRAIFLCCLATILLLLAACSGSPPTSGGSAANAPAATSQSSASTATMAIGNFQEYALPQKNSSLMRPAIDHEGRIWFGEMGHNYLAFFDPRTHTFEQLTPPHGASGIMGVTVAADDSIWFAEQYANYIGHYFPATRQFRIYDLPTLKTPDPGNKNATLTLPSAPNEIALDTHGNVWFTELNADSLGMLNPVTGHIKQYPLSTHRSVQELNPYGITIDPLGAVWFTEASTNHIGRLDPRTGKISLYTLQGSNNPLMEIASDAHGNIWATSFDAGLLLRFVPRTGTFTPYYAPYTGTSAGGLYGLLVTPKGEVWTTVTAENAIARLDVASGHFTCYQIPTPNSLPLGLVMDAQHTIWFTEAAGNKVGELKP